MLRFAAAGAVGAYQRHLSPRKGFCCAYRVHTGRASCSEFGRRVLLKLGVLPFFRLMPRQLARCRAAFASIQAGRLREEKASRRSSGSSCDCGGCGDCGDPGSWDLGGCDAGGCDAGGCACSF